MKETLENRLKNFIKLFVKDKALLRSAGLLYEDVKYFVLFFLRYPVEYAVYRYSLLAGKPYFGLVMQAWMTIPERAAWMRRTVAAVKADGQVNILEIGSWAGHSATVWAGALKEFHGGRGRLLCVDPWKSYISLEKHDTSRFMYRQMEAGLKSGDILRLFYHNVRASGADQLVMSMRAESREALKYLAPGSFDVIYVDGDHSYDGVISDLRLSAPLLKDGGFLCGDDLELQYHQVDKASIEPVKNLNFATDPVQETGYHPGVTLGLWKFFGTEVSAYNGFWLMRKAGSSWEKVQLG